MSKVMTYTTNMDGIANEPITFKYVPVEEFAGLMKVYDEIPWVYREDSWGVALRSETSKYREIDNPDNDVWDIGWGSAFYIRPSQIVFAHDEFVSDIEDNAECCYCEIKTTDGSTFYIADFWEHIFEYEDSKMGMIEPKLFHPLILSKSLSLDKA